MTLGVITGVRGRFGLEKLLALHMTGLFMFEEHFYNPTFIILVSHMDCDLCMGAIHIKILG